MKKVIFLAAALAVICCFCAGAACTCAAGCSSTTAISIPFTKDGAGEFCYVTPCLGSSVNSWNTDVININGTDFTNKWADASTYPAAVDNQYYVYYKASVSWAHVEALGSCSGTSAAPTNPPTTDTIAPTTPPGTSTIAPTAVPVDTLAPTTPPGETSAPTATPDPTAVPTVTPAGTTAPTAAPTDAPATPDPTAVPTDVAGTPGPTSAPGTLHTGNSTWFTGVGGVSYGGCGVADANVDSPNYVALNVQNSPGDYTTFLSRPIAAQYASQIGLYNNGLNCGRWLRVVISDYCNGINDGAQNLPFCRDGAGWVPDAYNGAELYMVVVDSCHDGNAWCRDDMYHIDLRLESLNRFVLNGVEVGDMYPEHFNNRHIQWEFVEAPNYTGDIKIGFMQNAEAWWSAISVLHLKNGMHGIDYYDGAAWVKAIMNSDMGSSYIVAPTVPAGTEYRIRVYDVTDQLINNGRIYNFSFPTSCGTRCPGYFTEVTYTTE